MYFRNSLSDLDLFGPEKYLLFFQRIRIHKYYRIRIVEGQIIIFTLVSNPEPQPDPQTALANNFRSQQIRFRMGVAEVFEGSQQKLNNGDTVPSEKALVWK